MHIFYLIGDWHDRKLVIDNNEPVDTGLYQLFSYDKRLFGVDGPGDFIELDENANPLNVIYAYEMAPSSNAALQLGDMFVIYQGGGGYEGTRFGWFQALYDPKTGDLFELYPKN